MQLHTGKRTLPGLLVPPGREVSFGWESKDVRQRSGGVRNGPPLLVARLRVRLRVTCREQFSGSLVSWPFSSFENY